MQFLTRFKEKHLPRSWPWAVGSGILYALGFCGFGYAPLAFICLTPVVFQIAQKQQTRKQALLLGWLTGLTAHLLVYTFLINMMRDFGHLPLPIALLGYTLLCLAQSGLFALWAYLTHILVNKTSWSLGFIVAITMVVAELMYPALFPSYLANSQYLNLIFIQSADIWGILGITFLLAAWSGLLADLALYQQRKKSTFPKIFLPALTLLTIFNLAYGFVQKSNIEDTVAHQDKQIRVGIVQVNMGMFAKHEDPEEGLERHMNQSLEVEKQGAELILWPESGFNFALPTSMTDLKKYVMPTLSTPLLFGGIREDGNKYYNTAFLLNNEGIVQGTYDKNKLLAFGEYIPFGQMFPFIYKLIPAISHFEKGTHQNPVVLHHIKYGILICYEDILPRFVNKTMQQHPHVLVNMTNDAWFGQTHEPKIHLALAIFRSIEHRRYLVRSTNSGISAIVTPTGFIQAQTPTFARANLIESITPLNHVTLYTQFGDWFAWLCVTLVAWALLPAHITQKIQTRVASLF